MSRKYCHLLGLMHLQVHFWWLIEQCWCTLYTRHVLHTCWELTNSGWWGGGCGGEASCHWGTFATQSETEEVWRIVNEDVLQICIANKFFQTLLYTVLCYVLTKLNQTGKKSLERWWDKQGANESDLLEQAPTDETAEPPAQSGSGQMTQGGNTPPIKRTRIQRQPQHFSNSLLWRRIGGQLSLLKLATWTTKGS